MKNYREKYHESIVKNLTDRQLGNSNDAGLSYSKTLSLMQNIKPTIALENCPEVGSFNNQIAEVQFNTKGNLVGSVLWGNDGVHIWNWQDAKLITFFSSGHGFTVRQVRWIPGNENLVLTSGDSGSIRLMDLNKNFSRLVEKFCEKAHFYSRSLKMCVNNNTPNMLLAGNVNGGVVNIDIRINKSNEILRVKNDDSTFYQISSLDINPFKCSEFCLSSHKDTRIYDCRNLSTHVQKFQASYSNVENPSLLDATRRSCNLSAKYNYNGTEILVAYSEGPVFLFSTDNSHPKKIYVTEKNDCKPPRFTMYNAHYIGQRSEFIAASTTVFLDKAQIRESYQKYTLYIWDKDSEKLINEVRIREEASWRFAVHPHLPVLAMNWDHNGVKIWE